MMASVTVKLRSGMSTVVDPERVQILTHAEWWAEGVARFGPDPLAWRFECSACGAVSAVSEFVALARTNAERRAFGGMAGQSCIGRAMVAVGAGVLVSDVPETARWRAEHNDLPIIGTFGSHRPCNWTTGGLFGGGTKLVTDDDGTAVWAFAWGR